MNSGSVRPSKPSLKMIAATAPASLAFWYFCTNGQVPRIISAMLPATSAGKSVVSQPLVLAPGLGAGRGVDRHDVARHGGSPAEN